MEEALLLQYVSTRSICVSGRPVIRRYVSVSSSTGKKPQVAPYSGDMFAIVARSATGRRTSPGPKYSTNFPTTPSVRSVSVTRRTRSVAVAFTETAREPEADHLRDEHRDRLAEQGRLRLDPAHAPAEDAEAVHHRRVRVGAEQRVEERLAVAPLDHTGEVLEN